MDYGCWRGMGGDLKYKHHYKYKDVYCEMEEKHKYHRTLEVENHSPKSIIRITSKYKKINFHLNHIMISICYNGLDGISEDAVKYIVENRTDFIDIPILKEYKSLAFKIESDFELYDLYATPHQ
jgi:hypothetical protein